MFARRRLAKTERDRRGTVRQLLEYACAKAGQHQAYRGDTHTAEACPAGRSAKVRQLAGPDMALSIYNEGFDEDVRKAVEIPSRAN